LEQKEERCKAKQDDQDRPRAEQPVWDITSTVEGDHRQKNDQRYAATLHQSVSGIVLKQTPEEQSVEEKDQQASPDCAEVVSICRDHDAENFSASKAARAMARASFALRGGSWPIRK
jgi:hypothetical protein